MLVFSNILVHFIINYMCKILVFLYYIFSWLWNKIYIIYIFYIYP